MLDFSVDVAHWPAAALQQRVAITTGSYDHAVDGGNGGSGGRNRRRGGDGGGGVA